jgi:hypothetical protein
LIWPDGSVFQAFEDDRHLKTQIIVFSDAQSQERLGTS